MKLKDKLPQLRKNNNLSQEMLADKLEMSRQAISKWESGTSYPDMATIMKLCKILNCSLAELIDDDAIGEREKINNHKIDINYCFKEFLDFITKSINMISAMSFFQVIKCGIEIFICGIILFTAFFILGEIVWSGLDRALLILPRDLSIFILNILRLIYSIFALILGGTIIVHIYKIRYLDYYVTVKDESKDTKEIEKPVFKEDKTKFVIRDPKDSSYNFIAIIGKCLFKCFQIILVMFSLPFIISFVFFVFAAVAALIYILNGTIFIGIITIFIGLLFVNYFCLEFLYNLIFKQPLNYKKLFRIIIGGFIIFGAGLGIFFTTLISFETKELDRDSEQTLEVIITENSNFSLVNNNKNKIVIDNSIDNIIVKINKYSFEEYYIDNYSYNDEKNYINISSIPNEFEYFKIVFEGIRNKEIITTHWDDEFIEEIRISEKNLEILKNN